MAWAVRRSKQQADAHGGGGGEGVLAQELAQAVANLGRSRFNRLQIQKPFDFGSHARRRGITLIWILLQTLHHDAIQIAFHCATELARVGVAKCGYFGQGVTTLAQSSTRSRRFFLSNERQDSIQRRGLEPLTVQWRGTGEQFIKQHSQSINVAPRIHVRTGQRRLFGTHIFQGANNLANFCCHRIFGDLLADGSGQAKIDDFGNRLTVVSRLDQDVGWFDIAMDHSLLMRVLYCLANEYKQLQPRSQTQSMPIAVFGDRLPRHPLHDEVRLAGGGRAGIIDLGDVRVIHHRQRLPLDLKTSHDLSAGHSWLDQLQRDLAAKWFLLKRQ